MNEQTFAQGMALLSASYPDYPVRDETTEVYWSFLKDMDNLDFEWAVKRHISQSSWFPKISELLKAAQERLPTPIDVWNGLIAAAEDGVKPEMDRATEKALAVIGGWEEFSRTPYDSLHYRFKDFKAAFLEARASQEHETVEMQPEIEGAGRSTLQIER